MWPRLLRGPCALVALVALANLAGCATLPRDPVERSLYIDLHKGTELGEDSGWVVDRLEIENQAEEAMQSVCLVDLNVDNHERSVRLDFLAG